MAVALHGKDGVVYWNGSAVALVTNWEANIGPSKDDITAMDSGGWGQVKAGIKRSTGSVTLRNNDDDAIHTSMRSNMLGGTAMVLRLYENGTAGHYYSGSALLDLALTVAFDGIEEAVYNFDSHGPWSYT